MSTSRNGGQGSQLLFSLCSFYSLFHLFIEHHFHLGQIIALGHLLSIWPTLLASPATQFKTWPLWEGEGASQTEEKLWNLAGGTFFTPAALTSLAWKLLWQVCPVPHLAMATTNELISTRSPPPSSLYQTPTSMQVQKSKTNTISVKHPTNQQQIQNHQHLPQN